MLCPNCTDQRLVMSERSGIEIDYCPNCRGVWLDRGELDKIIERASRELAPAAPAGPAAAPAAAPAPAPAPPVAVAPAPSAAPPPPAWGHSSRGKEYGYGYDDGYYKRKKRRSFLDELFD